MSSLFSMLRRHWVALVIILILLGGGLAYTTIQPVRTNADAVWNAALTWAGLRGEAVDASRVFWCPMHPQIKSNKENAVCPICNMALVELEGGVVEPPKRLTLTAQQVQQTGITTEPVLRRSLFREIDTTGRIDYDERRLAKITSWVPGKSRIAKLHVDYEGKHIEKGEPLVELYSPDLIVAQQEFLSAVRTLSNRSGDDFERELLASARQKLKYQGLSDAQIDELTETKQPRDQIPILAPITGTVHSRLVQEGQYVDEGDVLFELVDLSQLWVFADIFEEEIPLVELGMPVDITVQHLPGHVFHGEIAFIDHMVKSGTRTVPIRINVTNTDHQLKAGMFARVNLRRDWPTTLAVPADAVLWTGQRAVVIVNSGEGTFEPREVELGRKWLFADSADSPTPDPSDSAFGADRVRYHEVQAGLAPGESVVTSGAFLLNAESQFQSVLTKMLPPKSERATLEEVVGSEIAARIRSVLDAYFDLSQSLAEDKIDQVSHRLTTLSESAALLAASAADHGSDQLKADAARFDELVEKLSVETVDGAVDARTRFGRVSHELTKLLAANGGKTLFGRDLFQFECGMANVGYERWLWWGPEIHNPYMGLKMPKCGSQLDVLDP